MNKPTVESLVNFFRGLSSAEEQEVIKIYLAMNIDKEYVTDCLRQAFPELHAVDEQDMSTQELDRVWGQVEGMIEKQKNPDLPARSHNRLWYRYAAAVALFVLSSAAIFIYINKQKLTTQETAQQAHAVDLPGGNKAMLTLADGRTISLSDAENGNLVNQNGLQVDKTADGAIVYHVDENINSELKNSVTTPRGGQYQITLPDGSKAMLNAASSLTYPVKFGENERRVSMTGEVYFEIVPASDKNKKRIPFFVETQEQEIHVLGTVFNVNAYKDQAFTKTTLVEGSVRVTNTANGEQVLLKPGQELTLGKQTQVQSADLQQQLAWKNGEFVFKGQGLGEIMQQIGRWYDVETVCPPHLTNVKFTGIVSRSTPLSTLIKMIESTQEVHITVKGRSLIMSE